MEISSIHTQIVVHLHVNKTDFHMKDFALGLALKHWGEGELGNRLLLVYIYGEQQRSLLIKL